MAQATTRKLACPIHGCWRTRNSGIHVMCPFHWFKVPAEMRDNIWRLYRAERGSDSHFMAIDAAIREVEEQEAWSQESGAGGQEAG